MNHLRRSAIILGSLSSLACAGGGEAQPLRVGATFTLEQSGALQHLDTTVAGRHVVIVGSSGQILRSAAAGDLDITITHAPHMEQRLRDAGRVALTCPLFTSRFAIVGPDADPARARAASSAAVALRRIADAPAPFVSRGDSSGTHLKELEIWAASGRPLPAAPRYIESGTDQAGSIRIAAERGGYALVDLPTWTQLARSAAGLRVLFSDDTMLSNPYTLQVMRDATGRPADTAFARWAMREWRPRVAALGFSPSDGGCTELPT